MRRSVRARFPALILCARSTSPAARSGPPPKQKSVARRQRLAGSVRSLPVGNGEQLDPIAIWVFNLDADEAVIVLPLGLGHSGSAEPLPRASDFVAACELKAEVVRARQPSRAPFAQDQQLAAPSSIPTSGDLGASKALTTLGNASSCAELSGAADPH